MNGLAKRSTCTARRYGYPTERTVPATGMSPSRQRMANPTICCRLTGIAEATADELDITEPDETPAILLDVLPAAIAAAGILTGPAHRIDEHYRGDGPDGDKTSADNRAGTVSDFIPCPP